MSGDSVERAAGGTPETDNRRSSSNNGGRGTSRWPSWLGGVITAALSIAAIVVSILAYLDQHSGNESAAEAEQQTYATKLTFWLTNTPNNLPSVGAI